MSFSDLLISASPTLGLPQLPGVLMASRDLNSDPPVSMVSTLLTEPPPQASYISFL